MNINSDILKNFFNFNTTFDLLKQDFVINSILLAIFFSLLAGILGPFVISRNLSFASHGTSDLTLTGAVCGLVFGFGPTWGALFGALIAAIILTTIKISENERDAITSVIISFGLSLVPLLLAIYNGRTSEAFSLITGQNIALAKTDSIFLLAILTVISLLIIFFTFKKLLTISIDLNLAKTNGMNIKFYNILFAIILGITISQGVKLVGSLLVMALLVTPATAARLVTNKPSTFFICSTIFSLIAGVFGVIFSLAPSLPVSVTISFIAFVEFVVCFSLNRSKKIFNNI